MDQPSMVNFRIDWSGLLTKGRPVYCTTRTEDSFRGINHDGGYLIGWDQWSDGSWTSDPRLGLSR